MQDEVKGTGYKCQKFVNQITYKNFFFARSKSLEEKDTHLTRKECIDMIDSKKCDTPHMLFKDEYVVLMALLEKSSIG